MIINNELMTIDWLSAYTCTCTDWCLYTHVHVHVHVHVHTDKYQYMISTYYTQTTNTLIQSWISLLILQRHSNIPVYYEKEGLVTL